MCKKCKKAFRIDTRSEFDANADGYCPHCDNQWYIEIEAGGNDRQMAFAIDTVDGADQADLIRDERD